MTNSFKMAEMVNQANYAAMSYNELVTLNFAFLLAVGEIKPLMMKKRAEEMDAHTEEYVAKMNNYGASKAEIMNCLEKKAMRETPYGTSDHRDVDDQTPKEEKDNQDKGEDVLALPEHCPNTMDDVDVKASLGAIDDDSTQEGEDDSESSSSEGEPHPDTPDEMVSGNDQEEAKPSDDNAAGETEVLEVEETTIVETKGNALVEEAIEMMKTLPAPDDINVNAPYYVEADFAYGDTAKPGYSDPTWRNMGRKDLEDFRDASVNYEKLFLKHEVLASTNDYLIVSESGNSIKVRMYHFPEGALVKPEVVKPNGEISYAVTETDVKEAKHKELLLKKAIKKAKEISSTIGTPANTPFYDRFTFKKNYKTVDLRGEPRRFFVDEDTLPIIMSSFETYARLFQEGYMTLSKDNCVAATGSGNTIYVVLFNIPVKKKERKPRRKSEPAIKNVSKPEMKESKTSSSSAQSVNTPILNAVEMTKSLPLSDGTDNNAPYFVQREFIITESGDVVPRARPFSKNVSGEDELAGHRRSHCRFAKTMKASAVVSTDEYTAYIWNEGKNITVFYYNTRGLADAA